LLFCFTSLKCAHLHYTFVAGYNLIVDFAAAGLRETDFPSRVVVDTFMYSSTLNKELRIASFGEFDGWDTDANPSVVKDLKEQAGRMYPSLKETLAKHDDNEALPKGMEIRTGLRPFVCDGRLLLGRIPQYRNLYVNVGPGFNGESFTLCVVLLDSY
jgi:glycine/D-amino acid oxidase-like deaminating enzyme